VNDRFGTDATERDNERRGTGNSVIDTIAHSLDDNTSRRVFGDALAVGDVTVIPAARVLGRGGGGGGAGRMGRGSATPTEGQQSGDGAGGGLSESARPVGAFVVKEGEVSWRPALDLNRIILGGQIVAVVALLVVRSVFNHRARRRGRGARLDRAVRRGLRHASHERAVVRGRLRRAAAHH
jgi:uncharacterized spore protein YtfJ